MGDGTLAIGVVLFLGLAVTVAIRRTPEMLLQPRPVTRSFWCPSVRAKVTAEFEENVCDGTLVGVSCCTAFTPPSAVTCDRRCLGLGKLPD